MSDVSLPRPLPDIYFYRTSKDRRIDWQLGLENIITAPLAGFTSHIRRSQHSYFARQALKQQKLLRNLSEATLFDFVESTRDRLLLDGFTKKLRVDALAIAGLFAERHLGLSPFKVQYMGASAILSGLLPEMETGEGKTLTAGLAAFVAALAGRDVHVITANDYLAARDAAFVSPMFVALDLSVEIVIAGQQPDIRRVAYRAAVTYCSNKEIAFDYMKDRLMLGSRADNLHLKFERLYSQEARGTRTLLRGLDFAIVDEADSILIDESRTPLIISGETDPHDEQIWAETALNMADQLEENVHYSVNQMEKSVSLKPEAEDVLEALGEKAGGVWVNKIRREDSIKKAISAVQFFHRDEDYLVRENKIEIIDEYTGRTAPDRTWSDGLHQLIEVKEGSPATGRTFVQARMTYQKFFRRYRHLSGMTGTAREVWREFWYVYRLVVMPIPTNRKLRRRFEGVKICRTMDQKWAQVAKRIADVKADGRPVLVGTRSVKASDALSEVLDGAGIEHTMLNAAQDQEEAEIIERAGQPGQVTVATNMAGRGVDIKLSHGIDKLGGLHVILTERHEAHRIDRQLFGRCARQGDPGSYEEILSMEDPLLDVFKATFNFGSGRLAFNKAQKKAERLHSLARRDLLKMDQSTSDMLAFSGEQE